MKMNSSVSKNDETLLISLENLIDSTAGLLIVCLAYIPDRYHRQHHDHCQQQEPAHEDEIIRQIDPDRSVKIEQLGVFSSIKNTIAEKYIRTGLENGRKKMKENEPMQIRASGRHRLNEKDVKADVSGSNMMIYNLSTFQITKIKCDTANSIVEYGFRYPSLRVIGDYSIDGTVLNRKVNGNGKMDVALKNFDTSGRVAITETPGTGVQIKSLDMTYDFDDINVKLTGLKVTDMTEQQTAETLTRNVGTYLKSNRTDISRRIANEIKNRLNVKLKGHSSKDIMNVLSEGGIFMTFIV